MDSYHLIITGLLLDMVGAGLIVSPILSLRKMSQDELDRQALFNSVGRHVKQVNRNQILAWSGLGFLIFGFILQIIGNYIQYLNTLE